MTYDSRCSDVLLQSPLFDRIHNYLVDGSQSSKRVFVIAPYIKSKTLNDLLQDVRADIVVITRWDKQTLLSGSSDLEVYETCQKIGATLYIHNKIHLKIYSVDLNSIILSTANVSERGMGRSIPIVEECGTMLYNLSNNDRLYIETILKNSRHVDKRVYDHYCDWFSKQEKYVIGDDVDPLRDLEIKDPFLTSSLPMTYSIDDLVKYCEIINNGKQIDDTETRNCVFHDIENYSIDVDHSNNELIIQLQKKFFAQEFIKALDNIVPGKPGIQFGRVKEWIQNNCADVPVPSRREITENVQVLMSWFVSLGNDKYIKHIPGARSEMLYHVDREYNESTY